MCRGYSHRRTGAGYCYCGSPGNPTACRGALSSLTRRRRWRRCEKRKKRSGWEVGLEYLIGSYLLRGGGWLDISASVYKACIVSGEPHIADPNEVLRLEWREADRLPRPISNDARVAIPDFRAGKRGVVRDLWRDGVVPWTG